MSLFRLDASIRTEGSASRALGDIVEAEWRREHPDAAVTTRHIGIDPIPATAWGDAVTAGWVAPEQRTPQQVDAQALAATLVDELEAADALLFAVPLYNFGPSQHFKTWVDLVIADPRMGPGTEHLKGKPAVVATVLGGNYSPGTPREGWDHSTGWIERVLGDVWGLDLQVVQREFTLVGVNPALDQFTDLAKDLADRAEVKAAEHGRFLASRTGQRAAA
ncbi:FMN-dependent NADH-azoreductase [Schumannella sp. 10F1B-5-1]|uniref:FMN-dependent NADH-azoreductase n=1 Tax=Schumannella sp. 10F1B-5-1 TaxID=2590780 RepID=UPI001131BB78|nr:NAD(P)H-dependent oxidoreductase [Schumannella sp. 10F1B-5-1]TPW78457.1 flavodoxin family protein [Schumannella sp. 10F1B-5-1]